MYRKLVKRLLDVVSSVILLVLLLPLLVLVALAIRVEDGGPAIFRQQRVGRDGEAFTIFKFRGMPLRTPDLPSSAAARLTVTRVGRIIRRLNVDELPQLLNILRGEMSFIGPRPALATQAALLAMRREHGVLQVRPGLTGLAQINAYDGMPETEKVEWERRYVERITLFGDIAIVARTFIYLLKPPPAY